MLRYSISRPGVPGGYCDMTEVIIMEMERATDKAQTLVITIARVVKGSY